MKSIEYVYYEILKQYEKKKKKKFTQLQLSKTLNISLSTINLALKPLRKMYAIKVMPTCFVLRETSKVLYHWANIRNPQKDIIFQARVSQPPRKIESNLPSNIIFTAYSGFKFKFKKVPADYSEVYIYADEPTIQIIKKRFAFSKNEPPNFFVLKKGKLTELTASLLFVDLWNLPEWYAKDYLKALKKELIKIGILE